MFPWETLLTYINRKHVNINADHVVLIKQHDWSVSYAYVTISVNIANQKLKFCQEETKKN